ncbi:MAG: hypothetical protein ACKOZU_12685 [Planctomycetaceae bacterium]
MPAAGLGSGVAVTVPGGGARSSRTASDTLAGLVERSLRLSRAVLLGSRDPAAESCVKPVLTGSVGNQVPPDMGDIDGGPGTRLATLLFVGRESVATAAADLAWHQTRLRAFLENQRTLNAPALEAAEALHAAAKRLADRAAAATSVPDDVAAPGRADETTWPGWCLCRIDEAVRQRDLEKLVRWTAELEGATFWLADLHRWLDFLSANFAAAIDFQRESPEPFRLIDRAGEAYAILAAPSCLPAGMLTQHGRSSFLEIERQAERVFTMPADRIAELRRDRHLSPESILVPPARRKAFRAYVAALSPANRRTLLRAARTPYEGCYLVNMLFRASSAEFVDQQCEVLRRFDQLAPDATVEQLMGVLFYRGHSFSAMEWADRFQPELLEEAATPDGPSTAAFHAACRGAHDVFTRTGRYGLTLTLRDSLAKGMFDCVRATDLAITLFRNSGRSGVGHVRWSAGTDGHSVAAFWGDDAGRVLVEDPLAPADAPGTWPDAYFGGATWPEMLRDNPKPYAAELYVRGLDNYVWAAGYVIRGERAGTLSTAAVPYLRDFRKAGSRRIFEGPHPDF